MIPGYRIIVSYPTPRMTLSEKVLVTDEFRAEMNLWMRNFFGMNPPVVERGNTYVSRELGFIVFHHEDYAKFQAQTAEERRKQYAGVPVDSFRNNLLWNCGV